MSSLISKDNMRFMLIQDTSMVFVYKNSTAVIADYSNGIIECGRLVCPNGSITHAVVGYLPRKIYHLNRGMVG